MDPSLFNNITVLAAAAPGGGDGSGTIGGLIFFITLAIAFSFLCSMLEAGILSTPSSYIETQTDSSAGRLMQKYKQDVDEPISAILTLNTFAHTVGAAGAGAQAVGVFGNDFAFVITVILTLLILIFSEIIPKTIGAVYWKPLFTFNAYTLQGLIIILYPAVWAFNLLTRLITPKEQQPTVTRNELEIMAQISAVEGALDKHESLIVRNLLRLNEVQVYNIMTPRTVMLAFQQDLSVGDVTRGKKRNLPYSRIPIFDEHIDDITGFVLRIDIINEVAQDRYDVPLKDLMRPINAVPETITVAKVLEEFMARGQHIFLVLDEYGGTAGLITMEDAVESLLGREITDESDLVADLQKLAQQRYSRRLEMLEASDLTPPARDDEQAHGTNSAVIHIDDEPPGDDVQRPPAAGE